MAILLNVCGLILMTQTAPDVTLQQFYQKYYQCHIDTNVQPNQKPWPSSQDISMFFPEPREWWPIFTVDQLNSPGYKRIIKQGIKPGILYLMNISDSKHTGKSKMLSMKVLSLSPYLNRIIPITLAQKQHSLQQSAYAR